MARLAFETDSTRSISLLLDSVNSPAIDVDGIKITDGYHNLSHHGRSPEKLAQLQAAVANGTYKVSPSQIANSMINEMSQA